MKTVYDVVTRSNPAFGYWPFDARDRDVSGAARCTLRHPNPVPVDPAIRAKYEARYPRASSPLDQLREPLVEELL